MLGPERLEMVAGALDHVIYVVGGTSDVFPTHSLANVDAYDVATNTWSRRHPLPRVRSSLNGATALNGKIYVAGGLRITSDGGGGRLTKTLFVYDPATNVWAFKADMPTPGMRGVQGAIRGRLYVYAAETDELFVSRFFRYNPATDHWVTLARPPIQQLDAVGGVIGGRFYIAGGYTDRLYVYDPTNNSWTRKASMGGWRRGAFGGVVNGKLYVAGGTNESGEYLSSLEVYDPVTNRWTTKAAMPVELCCGASAVASGKLFALGGHGGDLTSKVMVYTP